MLARMSLFFEPEAHIRDFIGFRWREAEREILELVPEAQLEHVGSTAIPNAWTNGSVDVQVRVPSDKFKAAEKALGGKYDKDKANGGGKGYTVFSHEGRGIRVHLTAIDGDHDGMARQRDLLLSHALLRERYDAIKRRFQDGDVEAYKKAKEEFWSKQAS
jgi:GrpB-like predicted nucleotidyltransferase (UPF0157 family)